MTRTTKRGRTIALLVLQGVQLLDVAGPLDVFAEANAQAGRDAYELRLVGVRTGPVRSSSGARLEVDQSIHDAVTDRIDTLLVAGAPHMAGMEFEPALLDWLRREAPRARRHGSVCSGAFALAAAGLLDGRRITTHWADAERLVASYSAVTVDADAIFIGDGRLRTSAGVTAGLDLALSLVEEDLGRELAMRVASRLVMFFRRPGGQGQFSRKGEAATAGRSALQHVQRWIMANPADDLDVPRLAERAGLSTRHFARVFRHEVGITPAAWVEQARVASARQQLERGQHAPKQIAAACGFADVDTFRRAFVRHVGVTPTAYRRHQSQPVP